MSADTEDSRDFGLADSGVKQLAKYSRRHLKPVFEEDDEVYAAWWPDDVKGDSRELENIGGWFPGTVKAFIQVETDSPYGPTRYYNIEYDDGDKIGNIEDWFVFPKYDFLLLEKNGDDDFWSTASHHRCVYIAHDNEGGDWSSLVGWYVAIIDGKECHFSRLSEAVQAYDYNIIEQRGKDTERSELLEPEKYSWLLQNSDEEVDIDGGDDSSWEERIELTKPAYMDERKDQPALISEYIDLTEDNDISDGNVAGANDLDGEYSENKNELEGKQNCARGASSSSGRKKKRHAAMPKGGRSGTSCYRGVHWQKNRKKWMARYSQAHIGEKHINLGAFPDEKHAALAFDAEARKQGRPDEHLNFPDEKPTEEEINSWKTANKYKNMTKNGKKASSKYRGVCKIGDKFAVQCNINAVKVGLGLPDVAHLGYYLCEKVAAHVFDYACRKFGVPESELNFPLVEGESNKMSLESLAGAQQASRVVSEIKVGGMARVRKISKRKPWSRKKHLDSMDSSDDERKVEYAEEESDENELDIEEPQEEEDRLYELEAFISRPSPGTIEVKFVGSHSKVVKTEAELREELDAKGFSRFAHLLDRKSSSQRSDIMDEDICHDDFCMVCMDAGDLICCETCPCVVHAGCVHVSQEHYSGSRFWRCAICRRQAPTASLPKIHEADSEDLQSECEENDGNELDYGGADYVPSEDDSVNDELDDEYECINHLPSQKKRSKKRSKNIKASRGNANNAKPVEKLLFDGTIIGTYPSKREAAASEGLNPSNTLGLTHMDKCSEYRGIFWRYKGSSALPTDLGKKVLKSQKPVEQLCVKTGAVIKRFNSVSEAARAVGISAPSISNICNGWKGHKSAGGYSWRFSENLEQERIFFPGEKRLEQNNVEYPPIDPMRLPVEQLDARTGEVLASFDSKTDAAEAMAGSRRASGVLSYPLFANEGVFAYGFFWRPRGSSIVPPKRTSCVTKAVEQLDPSTERLIRRFDSCSSAARAIGLPSGGQSISNAARPGSKNKTAGGFRWRVSALSCSSDKNVKRKRTNKPSGTQSRRQFRKTNVLLYASEVIGQSVEVYKEKQWLKGTIRSFNSDISQHSVYFEESKTTQDLNLSEEQLRWGQWKKTQFGSENDECPICFNEPMESPAATVCGHLFCEACISTCIANTPSCPMCDTSLEGDDSKLVLKLCHEYDDPFRAVEKICMTTGKLLRVFPSAASASAHLDSVSAKNRVPSKIIKVCKGGKGAPKSAGGYAWRFQGSDNETQKIGERAIDGRQVECIDIETGAVVETYQSIRSAAELTRLSRAIIYSICLRTRREPTCGGFFWRFRGDTSEPWDPKESPNCKPVEQLSLCTGKVLKEYPSILKATEALAQKGVISFERWKKGREKGHGVGSKISEVCRSEATRRKSAHGFFWRYKGSNNVPPRI